MAVQPIPFDIGQLQRIFQQATPAQLADIAADIAPFIYGHLNARIQGDVRDDRKIRVTSAGSDVKNLAAGTQLKYPGESYFDHLDFRGGAVDIESRTRGRQANIRLGAGTDCMFDAIVSSCWAAEITAGRGTQGQTFTSLTGCTFKVYSLLSAAVAGMIAQGGYTKILMCNSETLTAAIDLTGLDAIHIFGLASNPVGGTAFTSGAPVIITQALNTPHFTKTGDGAGKNGNGIGFQGLGFVTNGEHPVNIANASAFDWLEFEDCLFNRVGATTLKAILGATTNLGIDFKVTNCQGTISSYSFTTGLFAGPDNLYAFNNIFVMTHFWGNDNNRGSPDRAWFEGGRHSVSATTTLTGVNDIFQMREMTIESTAVCFTTNTVTGSQKNFVFQNITVIATGDSCKFGDFGSPTTNANQGLFIDGVYGYPAEGSGVNPSGAFITVDADWTDVFIGSIGQYGWDSTYSGPTPTAGITHTLLDANQHSDTLLDAATRGDIVIANSTPKWTALPIGTTETIINSDGSDPAWTSSPKIGTKLTLANLGLTTDDQFYLDAPSAIVARLNWDFDDYINYNRSSNSHEWVTAGSIRMRLASSASGLQLLGYAHVGASLSTPTNTNSGDLTAVRLIVPNATIIHSAVSQLGGPVVIPTGGVIRFSDADDSNYVGIRSPAVAQSENWVIHLPADDPVANDFLKVTSVAAPDVVTEWATGGGGVTDAADLTYTPASNDDWGGSDPGDTDQALDELAARTSKGRHVIYGWQFVGNFFRGTGADPAEVHDTGSENNVERAMPFPNSGTTYAAAEFLLPTNYKDGADFTVRFIWTALTGSGDIAWKVKAVALSEGDTLNTTLGSELEVVDTLTTANDVHRSDAGTLTAGGSPVGDDWVLIEVYRDAADAQDTLSATAYLKAIEIIWDVDTGGFA